MGVGFLLLGIGLVITVSMQSSHAALLVILTALAGGQITCENALALAIGANLGSAATAAVVGMAASLGGRRLADTCRMMPLDVDDVYQTRVKSLHGAILSLIAEVQRRGLSEPWSTYLDAEQQASRHIVEAVKAMKHLRKNLSRFGLSPDQAVRGGGAPGSGRRGEIDQMS